MRRHGLSPVKHAALIGGGLLGFCVAIYASGLHIKAREAAPSVVIEHFEMDAETSLDEDDTAAMAEAAGIETPPDDGGAVLPFEPDPLPAPSEQVQSEPLEPPQDWPEKLLYRPSATAAGSLEAQGYRITLNYIVPIAPETSCGEGTERWPCGAVARTQFRNMLRGRALTCAVPDQAPSEPITTNCRVGNEDLGRWLVAQGWAEVEDGSPLADLAQQARDAHRGVHGAKPILPAIAVETAAPFEMQQQPTQPAPPLQDRGDFPPAPVLPAQ